MAKHTVLIAVTVDDKYSAAEVRNELVHCMDYVDSELFNAVSATYPATERAPKEYIVWCSEHVATLTGKCCGTYEELKEIELDGYSYSSWITTDDIEGIVDAVNNEFNGELLYQLRSEA